MVSSPPLLGSIPYSLAYYTAPLPRQMLRIIPTNYKAYPFSFGASLLSNVKELGSIISDCTLIVKLYFPLLVHNQTTFLFKGAYPYKVDKD